MNSPRRSKSCYTALLRRDRRPYIMVSRIFKFRTRYWKKENIPQKLNLRSDGISFGSFFYYDVKKNGFLNFASGAF